MTDMTNAVLAKPVADEVADCISRGEALVALERVAHETADDLPEGCTVTHALLVVMNRCYQAINLLNFKVTRQPTQADARRAVIEECAEAARNALVAYEWPPQDGDRQIDAVLDAILALAE